MAFVLNVLVNFIERKLFGKVKKKTWLKIKRPLSITISVVLVIFIIVFIMNLLIPQLKNSVSLFTDSLPTYKEDIINIMNINIENIVCFNICIFIFSLLLSAIISLYNFIPLTDSASIAGMYIML